MRIDKKNKIFVAGHKGMVGSAIYKVLKKKGFQNILYKSRRELDLLDQTKTFKFLKKKNLNLYLLLLRG